MTIVPGEAHQDAGRDGLMRAKRWLELTTRANPVWTHDDAGLRELLGFQWPHGGGTFTFDLGGKFLGEDLDGQTFVAEVKRYKRESDLPTHFRDFLAKCYAAQLSNPDRCNHFLWISWSPFQAKKWDEHTHADKVTAALLHDANRSRLFGTTDADEAGQQIDAAALIAVSERVWLLTLSDKQEALSLLRDHYGLIKALSRRQRTSLRRKSWHVRRSPSPSNVARW